MPHVQEELAFTAPPEVHSFSGLLFDMDGTIIDSTDAVVRHWHMLGKELGVDPEVILATSHGRRSIDTLQEIAPELANWEYVNQIEGAIPRQFGQDAKELPGSRALLDHIETLGIPWCIVTSGTRPLVSGWLDVMELAHPKNLVVAEDVPRGKPDPACYRLGRDKLGLGESSAVLVLEDAPAGVRSGTAAGFKVVALATTHTVTQLREAGADWIVRDLRSVRVKSWDQKTRTVDVEISSALQG